jgi:hypothetical protein
MSIKTLQLDLHISIKFPPQDYLNKFVSKEANDNFVPVEFQEKEVQQDSLVCILHDPL